MEGRGPRCVVYFEIQPTELECLPSRIPYRITGEHSPISHFSSAERRPDLPVALSEI